MAIRVPLPNLTDLLPPSNICSLEGKGTASVKNETDIYGNQVAVIPEVKTANQLWSIAAAYVALSYVQSCIDAYENHSALTLTDEAGTTYSVIITEYPTIDRHKLSTGGVAYTIKIVLGAAPASWSIPVVSLSGPRQFGR